MIRLFRRPVPFVLLLAFATFIPVMVAGVRVVQIPANQLPEDSLRLNVAPVSFWLHSISALLFGLLGPLQFARALRARFGVLHRLAGRIFVAAGLGVALSGLALLAQVDSIAIAFVDIARAVFGTALIVALVKGICAARSRDMASHRAWMIRAYAIGMGGATVGLILLPIYLIFGTSVMGLVSDLVFVGWWLVTIILGEWVIAQVRHKEVYT